MSRNGAVRFRAIARFQSSNGRSTVNAEVSLTAALLMSMSNILICQFNRSGKIFLYRCGPESLCQRACMGFRSVIEKGDPVSLFLRSPLTGFRRRFLSLL